MIYNYERVLRQVTYSNKKPAYYLNRQFRIICSELNGRFVSNEYTQTVSIHSNFVKNDNDNEDDNFIVNCHDNVIVIVIVITIGYH